MDTSTIRIEPLAASVPHVSEASLTPAGFLSMLRHPVEAVRRLVSVEFAFHGCVLCDEASLHTDLFELFERRGTIDEQPRA